MFNVDRETIRRLEATALRKLRHPARSKKIRPFSETYREYSFDKKEIPQKTYLDEMIEKHMNSR